MDAMLVEEETINTLCDQLINTLDELDLKLSFASGNNHLLTISQIWSVCRFLTNFRKQYLFSGTAE